jgi:hypothetical protein
MGLDRIVGIVLGLAAFGATAATGLARGLPFGACAARALAALVLGFLAGWLVFGKIGLSAVKEAAGPEAPAAPKPPEASSAKKGSDR